MRTSWPQWLLTFSMCVAGSQAGAQVTATQAPMKLTLQFQTESSPGTGRFHLLQRQEAWKPEETAIIVCDVWDLHHCLNAVKRVEEFAPRLEQVLQTARARGVSIIHAPSDCMDAYADHPARLRAMNTPTAARYPDDIRAWCSKIPAEERGVYPIDQSDGGEDDDPEEHARWAAKLQEMGRNPGIPWKSQSSLITIDPQRDYISDRGDEVWNILESRGIRNVILTGVHTNMCVLGRPFGLRQMARNGKNVVLMRDMTDTMYNPQRWPYVSHFTGTDLIVSHVERFVCPTITSDQFLGGRPFRFQGDKRPHLVIIMGEEHYETNRTLPEFAARFLGRQFRVTTLFASDRERHSIPGLFVLHDADALLLSVRRRALPEADMALLKSFVAAGKPVVGIRTASHAFALRGESPPEGYADWPELDAQVFGGNYHGDLLEEMTSTVDVVPAAKSHPILSGIDVETFPAASTLYLTSPLAQGTTLLLTGRVNGRPEEPAAWTFLRADRGRSFYTSLGHPGDFANPNFIRLLVNGIHWANGLPLPEDLPTAGNRSEYENRWVNLPVPSSWEAGSHGILKGYAGPGWYRCVVRIPAAWTHGAPLTLMLPGLPKTLAVNAWINGQELATAGDDSFSMPADVIAADDYNLVVLRMPGPTGELLSAPLLRGSGPDQQLPLAGNWQFRIGDEPAWSNMPLPSKFGGGADTVFSPEDPLFVARPLTRPGEFTAGIEGPACDPQGNIFAVNFAREGTIGRVTPQGAGEIFVELPAGSIGNGIRFNRQGEFFVADYARHNVLKVDPSTKSVSVLAHNDQMNQPNDLAIAADGTLYASDPNWKDKTGQIWRIDPDGATTRLADGMGTTNGIDLSPDGKTLYVNESEQRNIWAFTITSEKTLTDKRLWKKFEDFGFDGMRVDVDGNLYVTRYGKGVVVKLSPTGEVLREINVLGARPSNLCFGGPDGRTIYVTEVEFTRLVAFRVDRPGLSWQRWQETR